MTTIRHNWQREEVETLYTEPFMDLLFKAHTMHRQFHDPNKVQRSTLLSIKTGACPEDCRYCSQSGHYKTAIQKEKLLPLEDVRKQIKAAKARGATRFCMGAAWRSPPKKAMPELVKLIKAVKEEGLESCVTLGMLDETQSQTLKDAGLDYYNHNLDTSREYYEEIITTRCYQDRLDTLDNVRKAGISVCCGGIVGLGEAQGDRIGLLIELANQPEHPQSVPINQLVPIAGTPLGDQEQLDSLEFVRTIACARVMMPKSIVRLSAGRTSMSDECQALCFFAGANSIFIGDTLLTSPNPEQHHDNQLFDKLGLSGLEPTKETDCATC